MFNVVRYAQYLALLLPAYLVACVVTAIVVVLGEGVVGHPLSGDFLWWPLPWIFPAGSILLLAGTVVSVRYRRLDAGQLTGTAVSAWFLTLGACFALSSHRAYDALPAIISAAVFLAVLVARIFKVGVTKEQPA